jgi:CubicO group peptidase (beta-lactamase class C family)
MNKTQTSIQSLLEQLCAEGRERGIQVAAYHRGELIVNAFAGVADERTGALVSSDTLFPVFSVTKGLVATVIHQLVESGSLTYETRIAEIWPQFGANGKQAMTIEQMLRHTAGITTLPADTSYEETCDWDAICGVNSATSRTAANKQPSSIQRRSTPIINAGFPNPVL